MRRIETSLPEVFLIEPTVFGDSRGFFLESYHAARFAEFGVKNPFVQDNHSQSVHGTLRGLHYQVRFPQAKLCRVIRGEVLDVAVDIRRGSPCFGQWTSVLLSAENKRQIYVPRGFAHGFVVLSEEAEFLYKCDDFYHPEDECGVAWNDPHLGIDWTLQQHGIIEPLLSKKDAANPHLRELTDTMLPADDN